ncbi:unnamed protein product [Clonostachys rhizophaga]|uniref:L-asparaginase II n=1 Tax=Clonostachys rhizophaga TaxID=160324 RepID=A0A9N9V1D1_9HYPO|nr:unnamed protein product [Clonostachys rhizophaga]
MVKSYEDCVITDRGGVLENSHLVHAAVVDETGKLLFYVGNPSRVTLIRSAAKPAQALAIAETGALEKYGFEAADLALMCASHNSEPKHLERALAMLAKIPAEETDLRCGGHPSISPSVNQDWIRAGFSPTRICNNCSGKHIGMIAGAKVIGASVVDYHEMSHPIQQRVKAVVEELSGLGSESIQWGIDGCNMPAPALPLKDLAVIYASFATAAGEAATGNPESTRIELCARIFNAMTKHADQVAGEGRFCTSFMKLFGGQAFGKVGADGCYGIGIRSSASTTRLGAKGTVGIAVKIGDGNLDILYAAVVEILERLQIGTPEMIKQLDEFHHKKLQNSMGVVTGKIAFPFQLHKCE